MLRVTIVLHHICNKKCAYCSLGEPCQQTKYTDQEMLTKFRKTIKALESVYGTEWIPQIQGGEPTIWTPELIHGIIRLLHKYPQKVLLTNGTNKDTEWYRAPGWHMITHITDWEPDVDELHRRIMKLEPQEEALVVVTNDLLPVVQEFRRKYPLVRVTFSPADGPHKQYALTAEQVRELQAITDIPDMYTLPKIQGACMKRVAVIDLEQGLFFPCCKQPHYFSLQAYFGQHPTCTGCMLNDNNFHISEK